MTVHSKATFGAATSPTLRRIAGGLICCALLAGLTQTASAASEAAIAATVKRDTVRCAKRFDLDACSDAVRRNPSDAALLASYGDALMRAKRPADAARQYGRAAALKPSLPGLAAKAHAAKAGVAKAGGAKASGAKGSTAKGSAAKASAPTVAAAKPGPSQKKPAATASKKPTPPAARVADARAPAKRAVPETRPPVAAAASLPMGQFSNAAPETETH